MVDTAKIGRSTYLHAQNEQRRWRALVFMLVTCHIPSMSPPKTKKGQQPAIPSPCLDFIHHDEDEHLHLALQRVCMPLRVLWHGVCVDTQKSVHIGLKELLHRVFVGSNVRSRALHSAIDAFLPPAKPWRLSSALDVSCFMKHDEAPEKTQRHVNHVLLSLTRG